MDGISVTAPPLDPLPPQHTQTRTRTPSLPPLDSTAFPSLGRGISYLDPFPTPVPSQSITLRAYRSESQVGFWPLKNGGPATIERGYRYVA